MMNLESTGHKVITTNIANKAVARVAAEDSFSTLNLTVW